jgi:hypothetical protein
MRRFKAHPSILVMLVLGGCATPKQTPHVAQQAFPFAERPRVLGSASSSSIDSDGGEEGYGRGGKGLTVPHRARNIDAVDLVVRPDIIAGQFAVREVRPTSQEALEAARATSAEIFERLGKALGKAPSFQPRGVAAEKVIRRGTYVGVVVTVDGLVEIGLPAELDFWARSQLFISVMESTAALANQVEVKDEPLRSVKFEGLGPAVKDPEAYRPQLTERWVAQTRAFATLAQAKDSPLALVDCAPPRSITQTRASIDEVTLQLAVTCRLDIAGSPRTPGRARRDDGRE